MIAADISPNPEMDSSLRFNYLKIDKKMNNDKSIIHFYLMFIYYAAMLQVFQQALVLKKNY